MNDNVILLNPQSSMYSTMSMTAPFSYRITYSCIVVRRIHDRDASHHGPRAPQASKMRRTRHKPNRTAVPLGSSPRLRKIGVSFFDTHVALDGKALLDGYGMVGGGAWGGGDAA